MTEKNKRDEGETKAAKGKKRNIWEDVISDVANANMTPDSHLLLLGILPLISHL